VLSGFKRVLVVEAHNACDPITYLAGVQSLTEATMDSVTTRKAMDPLCPNNHTMFFTPGTPWRKAGIYAYGLVLLTVQSPRALQLQFYANNGTELDSTIIER
jgi:hypothetical protein